MCGIAETEGSPGNPVCDRGYGKHWGIEYSAKIDDALIEAKTNGDTYLRKTVHMHETYYVSKYDVPSTQMLIEGVQVLKKLIEHFNTETEDEESKVSEAENALKELKI